MTGLAFLLIALALSIVGSLALWVHYRKPTSIEHGVEEFAREMRARAPDRRLREWRGPSAPRGGPPGA